jgi:4'-phosphopantetheinyl transferase
LELIWKKLDNEDGHSAGRQLLEQLYRQVTGCALPPIAVTDRGKPYFENSDWHFSISHTKNHVFCCISRENVGIDAEEMDRTVDLRLADRYLSDVEKTRLEAEPDQNAALLRLWVLKEAYAKRNGKGLGNYLKETNFDSRDKGISCIDGCIVAVLEGE